VTDPSVIYDGEQNHTELCENQQRRYRSELHVSKHTHYLHVVMLLQVALLATKLCYRKDDRAMRLIYECPESF